MIVHVVLFSPRPDLSAADRAAVLAAIESASRNIPSIKRLRIGKSMQMPKLRHVWARLGCGLTLIRFRRGILDAGDENEVVAKCT